MVWSGCSSTVAYLVLCALDSWHIHVVGRGAHLFVLLAGEDVLADHVDLGVTVLASLRGRGLNDLAWVALHDAVAVLLDGAALHGEGIRSVRHVGSDRWV
jgi:hypothetical protein